MAQSDIDKLVDRFVATLLKKDVSVKQGNVVQGRKAFNLHQAGEDFIGAIGEDESMTSELVKKAKERLEELKNKPKFVPSASLIPELFTFTSKSGSTTYWIKRELDREIYTLIAADLSTATILIDAIVRLISPETRTHLLNTVDKINRDNENDKMTISGLISEVLNSNRNMVINSLDSMPKTFTTNPKTPAMTFFDISNIPSKDFKPTPAWDSLTSRMVIDDSTLDGGKYFMAFIWSIFEEDDKNRVFLYWYDSGNQGKSVVVNILMQKLEGGATSFDFFNFNNHTLELLTDKRLILQHEAKVKKLSAIQIVKQLTGGDEILINPKGRKAYSIKINAKIMVVSNMEPMVSSEESELSRLLPIRTKVRKKDDFIEDFDKKLSQEFDDFLGKCRDQYKDLAVGSKGGNFLSITDSLKNIDDFKDYATQLVDILKDKYELQPYKAARGTNFAMVQKFITKVLERDEELKSNITIGSPAVHELLKRWAIKSGGDYRKAGKDKGFIHLFMVEKKEEAKENEKASDIPL